MSGEVVGAPSQLVQETGVRHILPIRCTLQSGLVGSGGGWKFRGLSIPVSATYACWRHPQAGRRLVEQLRSPVIAQCLHRPYHFEVCP